MVNQNACIAIVGGGAAGVATFISAVKHRVARRIFVIDPHPVGAGIAYSSTDEDILCNSSADMMSVVPGKPLDLVDYLEENDCNATWSSFIPRSLVRRYLVNRFRLYRDLAQRAGIEVTYLPYRFRSLKIAGDRRYVLRFTGSPVPDALEVTDVVFCTGHGAACVPDLLLKFRDQPTFVECPYPEADMLGKVPPKSRVLVLGTKLSAIDATILLCREGHKVVMISPSGELPSVRERIPLNGGISVDVKRLESLLKCWDTKKRNSVHAGIKYAYIKYVASILTAHTDRSWRRQFSVACRYDEKLREEISIAESGGSQWQDIIVSYLTAANALYLGEQNFSGGLHPEFRRTLGRYTGAIALPNARKLMNYIEGGSLSVGRGELFHVAISITRDSGGLWSVDWGEGNQYFDAVVSAAGFRIPCYVFNDSGELELDVLGQRREGAVEVSSEMAARHPCLHGDESIWFVGNIAQTRLLAINGLPFIVALADRVITNMVSGMQKPEVEYGPAGGHGFDVVVNAADAYSA